MLSITTKTLFFLQKGLLKALAASVLEAALNGELTNHLGYTKHQPTKIANARHGHSPKKIKTNQGELPIQVPRDLQGSFEPQLIKKHKNRFDGLDNKVIALYAKGMSVSRYPRANQGALPPRDRYLAGLHDH